MGVTWVWVGPGLKRSLAPGWKFDPVTVYGPEIDARFGVIEDSTGPGLTIRVNCRVATWSGSSVTASVNVNVPTVVGPEWLTRLRRCPSALISIPIVDSSTSPGAGACCDQVIGAPPPEEASCMVWSYAKPTAASGMAEVRIVSGSTISSSESESVSLRPLASVTLTWNVYGLAPNEVGNVPTAPVGLTLKPVGSAPPSLANVNGVVPPATSI